MSSFAAVASKSTDPAFLARLRIAITEQCRYTLGRPPHSGESPARHAWEQQLARSVLMQIDHAPHLARMARLCLLPAEWGSYDPDDDAQLQARVAERFPMFAHEAPPE